MYVSAIEWHYLKIGFMHVIPLGFDHILFILCIFFFNSRPRSVILQSTIFTVAHCIMLALVALGYVITNAAIVEPIIALSILIASIENIIHKKVSTWRYAIIFCFGIIHGMGFAIALKDAGLSSSHFITSLLAFNLGVELAQITIILLAYFLIAKWFSKREWYHSHFVYPLSSLIGCIALYWTIDRLFL